MSKLIYEKTEKYLIELIERDTPMKVIKTPDWYYHCPMCKEEVDVYRYCYHCGQRLDWSE